MDITTWKKKRNAKLCNDLANLILEGVAITVAQHRIAAKYHVSHRTVCRIWKEGLNES